MARHSATPGVDDPVFDSLAVGEVTAMTLRAMTATMEGAGTPVARLLREFPLTIGERDAIRRERMGTIARARAHWSAEQRAEFAGRTGIEL